eukprot:jgi/Orpsp1_1/1176607/evm.model.c7180000058289.1
MLYQNILNLIKLKRFKSLLIVKLILSVSRINVLIISVCIMKEFNVEPCDTLYTKPTIFSHHFKEYLYCGRMIGEYCTKDEECSFKNCDGWCSDIHYVPSDTDDLMLANDSFALKKRSINYLVNYGDSDYVRQISSIYNSTILKAYLSKPLAEKVRKLNYVKNCIPDLVRPMKLNAKETPYYNIDDIKNYTHWKDVTVQKTTPFNFSALSQREYDPNKILDLDEYDGYDRNYYYPSTAGKDVDIIIIDSSFHFDYSEFSNTKDRTVRYVVGGLENGVAKSANIYDIATHDDDFGFPFSDNVIIYQYIIENLIRPHKTVINASHSVDFVDDELELYDDIIEHGRSTLNKINELGGIFVNSGGNENMKVAIDRNTYHYRGERFYFPCSFKNVICIGGVTIETTKKNPYYVKAGYSNYGPAIDIYALFGAFSHIETKHRIKQQIVYGTFFSSPIVAGVIATIL